MTTTEFRKTTYERAVAGYDDEFERRLLEAITRAIFETSLCSDAKVMALRTGETCEALVSCLLSFAAMSPQFDTPSELRKFTEIIAKRIRRDVAKARARGVFDQFGARRGGNA